MWLRSHRVAAKRVGGSVIGRSARLVAGVCALALAGATVSGCGNLSPTENLVGGAVVATALGAQAPTHEIQQIFYFGVFDPQGQLPAQMYRIRVHGQASFISQMQFASGWVPAAMIDSLGSSAKFGDQGSVGLSQGANSQLSNLSEGRRLMLFGPQGFREAPKDHRLVIVMGATPEGFFGAIDETVGKVSEVMEERRNSALVQKLFQALTAAKADRERLIEVRRDIELSAALQKAARQ